MNRRGHGAVEVAAVFVAILIYIWWLRWVWAPAWVLIFGFVVVSHVRHGERPGELGFRVAGLGASLKALVPWLLLVVVVLLAAGWTFGTMQRFSPERHAFNLAQYVGWGLFQQYLLNGYFVNRLRRVVSGERAISLCAAALFCAVHFPNPFLMGVGAVGGYVSVRIYLRFRNLFLVGMLHGVVGFCLHLVAPDWITGEFLVGRSSWVMG